jgi:hypothetical protein
MEAIMSAYIVGDETLNKIVSHLHLSRDLDWLKREFSEVIAGATGNFCVDLGAALFALNICAVEARYGEGQAKEFRDLDYQFSLETASPRQVYASIKELQYQCAEGDVPETALYKLLVQFRAAVADRVIESSEHQGEIEAELENSLYSRCRSCCKGLRHTYQSCGAPVARRLLVGVGRIHENETRGIA